MFVDVWVGGSLGFMGGCGCVGDQVFYVEHVMCSLQAGSGGKLERLEAEEREHPTSNMVNDGLILPHETREVSV